MALSVAASSENGGSEDGSITVYHAQHQMEFECVRCEECTSIAKSQPVNKDKPFDKRKCNLCSSVDRRMQRKKVMEAFKKKPHEQKVAYYKECKNTKETVMDIVQVSQAEEDYSNKQVKDVDMYLPFHKWKRNRILEDPDKAKLTPQEFRDWWDRELEGR